LIAVLDTSVALKWYVAESDSAAAETLLALELAAPDFILVELANALWKKVRRGEIEPAQTQGAHVHLAESVKLVPSASLAGEALSLAMALPHPVYDCLFLALARDLDVPLVTADERLCRRVRASPLRDIVIPLHEWEERNA